MRTAEAMLLFMVLIGLHVYPTSTRPVPGDIQPRYLELAGQPPSETSSTPTDDEGWTVRDPKGVISQCMCRPGEGAVYRCTQWRAAQCRACPAGTYSSAHDQSRCTSCSACAQDEVQVSPCTAKRDTICMQRDLLRPACTFFRLYRSKGQKRRLALETVDRLEINITKNHELSTTAPEVLKNDAPGRHALHRAVDPSPPGFPLLLYLCGFTLIILVVGVASQSSTVRGMLEFLPGLPCSILSPSPGEKRQADYFHAASSCYQVDEIEGTRHVKEAGSSWYNLLYDLFHGPPHTDVTPPENVLSDREASKPESRDFGACNVGSKKKGGFYAVYCPATPLSQEASSVDEHGFFKDTFSSEGGTLAHNNVAVIIPKMVIPEGLQYTFRGKTHTDIPNWKQYVDQSQGDVIIAPVIECHVEGDFRFSDHVTVCAPHCVDESNLSAITVYCGDARKGVSFKQIPHMRHRDGNSRSFYSADEDYVFIHTSDFQQSQFICTIGDRQIALQLQELVLYEHIVREKNQELKLKVKLCDSRNNIPDLRQAYFEQEEMRLVESCSWRRLELPNNEVTTNSEVSIELQPAAGWDEKKIGSMKFPLKMTHRLVDVLDSRNNELGEFTLIRTGTPTRHFSGTLHLRVTEKIEEVQDRSHSVASEGPGGVIRHTNHSSSHVIETNKSCNSLIPIRIKLESQSSESWSSSSVSLQFAFDYISSNLPASSFPSFYRKMGLTEGAVDAIKERHRDDFKEQKMQVLLDWQQRRGKMATACELLQILVDIGLRKFAEDLQMAADAST